MAVQDYNFLFKFVRFEIDRTSFPPLSQEKFKTIIHHQSMAISTGRMKKIPQFICRQWNGDNQSETIGSILLRVLYFREDFDRYLQQAADDRRRTEEDRMYLEKLLEEVKNKLNRIVF